MSQAQIIAFYTPILRRVVSKWISCKADVEDIVQDTFEKWLSIDIRKVGNTRAYLLQMAFYKSLNHLKVLKKRNEKYFDDVCFSKRSLAKSLDLSHLDMRIEMNTALNILQNKLLPLERAVYLLREVFDFDYESIQKVLKKKGNHCRQLLSRAKKKLNQEMQHVQGNSLSPVWKKSYEKAFHFGSLGELIRDIQKDISLVVQ